MNARYLSAAALAATLALAPGARAGDAGAPGRAPAQGAVAPALAPQGPALLAFLNDAVRWYRQTTAQAQAVGDPAQAVLAAAARQQARQVVQQAFAFARADVALHPDQPAAPGSAGAGTRMNPASAAAMSSDAAAAAQRAQAEVDALARRAQAASGEARATLDAQLAEARSELALAQARRDALAAFAGFLAQVGAGAHGAAGLLGQIDELQRTLPEIAAAEPAAAPASAASAAAPARRGTPGGIVALAGDLVAALREASALGRLARSGAALREDVERLRAPLLADLRATLAAGDQLTGAPQTDDPEVLAARRADLDRLTGHFKQVSAAVAPIGKQAVLLDAWHATVAEWRADADAQYDADWRALVLRLGTLALAVGGVLAASAFWRRATFRYVRDLRRRQQSLLVRRVVVSLTLAGMIFFSLVTELGSIATFAGFITAGLAVALQNVILSFVAYFFLIGRYGVRVGDRVQIGGVTGDVMDIGLVRLHLMELGADGQPTGRVVVFSNAVLFQPTASFFKQIPGSAFTWHQVVLTFSPATEYQRAERRLLDAVDAVYATYRDRIAAQHAEMEQNVSIAVREPRPQSQLRLREAGLEMTIRFPAPLESATSVDDQVTRALLDAIDREPRLKLVGSATPTLQAEPEPAPA